MSLDTLKKRVSELSAEVHEGLLQTKDENGRPAWVSSRDAIGLMRELLRYSILKGSDNLTMLDIPEDLRHQVVLWSNVTPAEGHGAICVFMQESCMKIVGVLR